MGQLDIPPVWTLAAWVCAALIAYVVPSPGWDSLGLRWLGLLWIGISFLFLMWAAIWFKRLKTPIHPGHDPKSLITQGPYRLSRNPIYLAMVTSTAGLALFLGSVWGLLPVVGLWYVLNNRFAAPEEARLLATFGDEGADYVKRVRRWI